MSYSIMKKGLEPICAGVILLAACFPGSLSSSLWAQTDSASRQPVTSMSSADNSQSEDVSDDRMQAPPPVSGQAYPAILSSQERSNYIRGGVVFTGAYSDNAVGAVVNGHPVTDESYSVAPMVALDQTTSTTHLLLTYAPGFTFYQHTSSRNEADENAAIEFEQRLSPRVTLSAKDNFQKSSDVFNQPDFALAGGVSGGALGANSSVIAPIAERLSNLGNAGISYQFDLNSMAGASAMFANLHYPDPAQVPGLSDSVSQAGSVFYSHRIARRHYVGVAYQYQRLLSYPAGQANETQTHAALFFLTVSATSKLSISLFGGPQYSATVLGSPFPAAQAWTPAAGASINWQTRSTSLAASYSRTIAGGGGLVGAVQLDSATAAVQQRMTHTLSGSVAGGYAQNDLLASAFSSLDNGHSISGTAALQQQFGQHLGLQAGYTRIHQSYSNIAVITATPNTNREFVSLSYQFSKALGR